MADDDDRIFDGWKDQQAREELLASIDAETERRAMNPTVEQTADKEYTDLCCHSPETAQRVLDYLNKALAQEDAADVTAYIEKSTLRLMYLNTSDRERHGWDMQLMGFRDGIEASNDS